MDLNESWQCRYFVPTLPSRLARKNAGTLFPNAKGPMDDIDVYFIRGGISANVKVRKLRRTIKIKSLLRETDDWFELWRTDIDHLLPSPVEVWAHVFSTLRIEGDAQLLQDCADPDRVVEVLCGMHSKLTSVTMVKRRMSYASDSAHIEVVEVEIGSTAFYSIAFESPDLAQARVIRDPSWADDLGKASNYVDLCSKVVSEEYSGKRD